MFHKIFVKYGGIICWTSTRSYGRKRSNKKTKQKNRKAIKEKHLKAGIGIIDSYGVQIEASYENRENKEGIMILNNAQRL